MIWLWEITWCFHFIAWFFHSKIRWRALAKGREKRVRRTAKDMNRIIKIISTGRHGPLKLRDDFYLICYHVKNKSDVNISYFINREKHTPNALRVFFPAMNDSWQIYYNVESILTCITISMNDLLADLWWCKVNPHLYICIHEWTHQQTSSNPENVLTLQQTITLECSDFENLEWCVGTCVSYPCLFRA